MTLLIRGRTVTARAPRAHVPSSKESEWSVNTLFSSNSILPSGPSLPTALENFHSRQFGQQERWRNLGLDCKVCSQDKHHILTYGFRVHCLKPQMCMAQWCSHALRCDTFPLGNQCSSPVFACEQGYWQGLCVILLIRLCWESWTTQSPQAVLFPVGMCLLGGGVSSHTVLTGFFLLVLFETKLFYKMCWITTEKYVFSLHVLCGRKKRCFLKFLFNSYTEMI